MMPPACGCRETGIAGKKARIHTLTGRREARRPAGQGIAMDTSAAGETKASTVDRAEVARFAESAESWWDPSGEFRPLHQLNPVRLAFIRDRLAAHFGRDIRATKPFAGLRLLDVGCGGGLVSEPLARLAAPVTGIDPPGAPLPVPPPPPHRPGPPTPHRHTPAT